MLFRNRLRVSAIVTTTVMLVMPTLVMGQDRTPQAASATIADTGTDDPVIVVSVTSLDRLMKDVNYVSSAVNQAGAGMMFGSMVTTFTNGIDRTRPWGVALFPTETLPEGVLFLPANDIKRLLRTLEAQTGPAEELDDGTLVIQFSGTLAYIRQQGSWAYVAQSSEALEALPSDPTPWLAGMGDEFDLGVRVNVQTLTPEQREGIIGQIRQGFDQAMQTQGGDQTAQIQASVSQSLAQLEAVINDTDVLQFGFAIEPDQQQLRFSVLSTAVDGTELAAMYAAQKPIPSKFASMIQPEAAGFFHGAGSIGPQGIEQAKLSLSQATDSVRTALETSGDLSAGDQAEIEAFFERLIEIGIETISEGKSDGGGLLTLDNQELNAVAGFFVSDGSKVADLAKDLAAKIEAQNDPRAPKFTFDADTYEGVTLHYVDVDVPDGEEQARDVFGPTLRLTIGTGADAVYLALGKSSEAMLKKLIDTAGSDTGGDRPLSQGQVRLLPILEFAQTINSQEALAAMIDTLIRANDTDTLGFVSESISLGNSAQFTLGEGILKAIGAAIAAQQGQNGGGQF